MSDTEMIDSGELHELRRAVSAIATPDRPPLESIRSRGRARQRRRRQGAAAAAVAGSVVGIAVGASLSSGSAGGVPATTPTTTLGAVRTAAYTLVSHSDGTATLTVALDKSFDPTTLQRDLARAGIPALVTMGRFCSSDPEPAGFSRVVSYDPGNSGGPGQPAKSATLTIDPAAMPAGAELSVGDVPVADDVYHGIRQLSFALVDKQNHTCSSATPTTPPPDGASFLAIPGGSQGT